MSKEASRLQDSGRLIAPAFGAPDLAMIFMATGWGLNFLIIKLALVEISPLVFTSLRHIGATALLLLVLVARRVPLTLTRREWLWVIGLGLIGITIHQPLAMYGVAYTTAGNAGLLLSSTPVFVALLNHLLQWERLERRGLLGIGISFVGMASVIGADGKGFSLSSSTLIGDLICLAGALMWALYTVLAQPLLKRHDSGNLSAVIMLSGTIPLLAISMPSFAAQSWSAISPGAWTGIAYSFLVSIALGSLIWNWGIQKLGGARASTYNNLSPAIALGAGALFLGEQLTPLRVTGAVIVIVGIYLARTATLVSKLEAE